MKTLLDYFSKAQKQGFAIGAFNAANLEVLQAIVNAAQKLKSPVIVESSPGETAYGQPENLDDLVENAKKKTGLPIFLNLDHGNSLKLVQQAIEAGYEMVHFDGSLLSFEENKKLTKKAVAMAKKKGLVVEGELGYISGKSEAALNTKVEDIQKRGVLTDPAQAGEFVRFTGVDVLAAFIGNVHGVYKGAPKLDFERLEKIREITGVFLSLHGGSGIPSESIKKAIARGIVKINVNTELRLAYKQTVKKVFGQSKEVAVYKLMPPVVEAVQKIVEEKIKMFGSAGKI